jgi:hypothetical protein
MIGLVAAGLTLRETARGHSWETQQFEFCISGFCVLIGLLVLAWWQLGKWLAVVGGVVGGLYGCALILLGTEDVGGFAVSLPIGGFLIAFCVLNAFAASLRVEAA